MPTDPRVQVLEQEFVGVPVAEWDALQTRLDALETALRWNRARWVTVGGPWSGPAIALIDRVFAGGPVHPGEAKRPTVSGDRPGVVTHHLRESQGE